VIRVFRQRATFILAGVLVLQIAMLVCWICARCTQESVRTILVLPSGRLSFSLSRHDWRLGYSPESGFTNLPGTVYTITDSSAVPDDMFSQADIAFVSPLNTWTGTGYEATISHRLLTACNTGVGLTILCSTVLFRKLRTKCRERCHEVPDRSGCV